MMMTFYERIMPITMNFNLGLRYPMMNLLEEAQGLTHLQEIYRVDLGLSQ
jgi:hypothetical protein